MLIEWRLGKVAGFSSPSPRDMLGLLVPLLAPACGYHFCMGHCVQASCSPQGAQRQRLQASSSHHCKYVVGVFDSLPGWGEPLGHLVVCLTLGILEPLGGMLGHLGIPCPSGLCTYRLWDDI